MLNKVLIKYKFVLQTAPIMGSLGSNEVLTWKKQEFVEVKKDENSGKQFKKLPLIQLILDNSIKSQSYLCWEKTKIRVF